MQIRREVFDWRGSLWYFVRQIERETSCLDVDREEAMKMMMTLFLIVMVVVIDLYARLMAMCSVRSCSWAWVVNLITVVSFGVAGVMVVSGSYSSPNDELQKFVFMVATYIAIVFSLVSLIITPRTPPRI